MAISHLRPAAIRDFYNITKMTQPQLRNVELYINNPKLVTLRLLHRRHCLYCGSLSLTIKSVKSPISES